MPPARSAILDFFGLRGATIERVETLPTLPAPAGVSPNLMLGRPVPLEEAEQLAAFPVLIPKALGGPDHVFYSSSVPGGRVSLVYRPEDGLSASRYTGVGLLVTEFRGDLSPELIGKLVGGGANMPAWSASTASPGTGSRAARTSSCSAMRRATSSRTPCASREHAALRTWEHARSPRGLARSHAGARGRAGGVDGLEGQELLGRGGRLGLLALDASAESRACSTKASAAGRAVAVTVPGDGDQRGAARR